MNVFDLFEYNEEPENEGVEKLRFHLKGNRFKSLAKKSLHRHKHALDERDVEEGVGSMTKGMKSNHSAFTMQEDAGYVEKDPRSFLDDDFYAFNPETKVIKDSWGYKSVGRRHSEYVAQQNGWQVVSGMRAKGMGLLIKAPTITKEARKSDINFDIEDIKRLEQIKDLATLKAQAMSLIAKPSAKPMKPEKVEWFRSALENMNSPMKVIKLMYDLMLSGEGHQVIGSRSSMNPNSYRSRFGEEAGISKDKETKFHAKLDRLVHDTFGKRDDEMQGVAEATGNPGMPTPYDQGREDAKKGRPYDNPYDQPGEEREHSEYKKGYQHGKQQGVAEGFGDMVKGIKRKIAGKEDPTDVQDRYARAARREIGDANKYNNPAANRDSDQAVNRYKKVSKVVNKEGVAEGLNEFAPDGFNGGDDDEGFSPEIAKMAQEDGFTKGVSLADGATLERAIAINYWHSQHGGMYKQYFVKGFKAGRMNKIKHDNERYNLNLKLMKDGSIRRGEQGVAEYGDTARGQKMLTKVQKRAVDRMIKADDKRDAKAAKKNQDTANRAWDRMTDVDEAVKSRVQDTILEEMEEYLLELELAGYEVVNEGRMICPECGGAAYQDQQLAEAKDACYSKVKSRYKVWPSAYASGALVRCRKVGAKNWGNKSKK